MTDSTGQDATAGELPPVGAGARVAVTGGSGAVGQAVIRHLLAAGYEVVSLDRAAPRMSWWEAIERRRAADAGEPPPDRPSDLPDASGARFVFCDLRDRATLQPALEACRAVLHLGEIPNEQQPYPLEEIFATNTAAAATVLETAADLKLPRVVYTSSAQAYGIWGADSRLPPARFERLPMGEDQPLRPQNAYAMSKLANESYAALVAGRRGLSVAAFRLPSVRGRGVGRPPSALEARWLARASGDGRFDADTATYITKDDAARAYVAALTHVRPGFEAYNIFAADLLTERPIRERLAEFHPDLPPLPGDWPDGRSFVSIDKACDHLGWAPKDHLRPLYLEERQRQRDEALADARALVEGRAPTGRGPMGW